MFRNPRELASPFASSSPPKPSTGHPPTPEPATAQYKSHTVGNSLKMTSSTTPLIGRTKAVSKGNSRPRPPALTSGKARPKPNGSILNFFKKTTLSLETEASLEYTEESLFLEDEGPVLKVGEPVQTPTPPRDDLCGEDSPDLTNNVSMDADLSRFNEESGPIKRRRMETSSESSPLELTNAANDVSRKGPFIEDSDDGDDEELNHLITSVMPKEIPTDACSIGREPTPPAISGFVSGGKGRIEDVVNPPTAPSLKQEQTSIDEGDEYQGIDDFIDDEFPEEGEEYVERRWMEQQRHFEMDGAGDAEFENNRGLKTEDIEDEGKDLPNEQVAAKCPVCSVAFDGLTDQEASIHVNDCLDGKTTMPSNTEAFSKSDPAQLLPKTGQVVPAHKRFQRATVARPGQENPFGLASNNTNGSSAFTKIMSGHAEDTAWAAAAASESASRGKPAYQRTCPFYKILPGFSICVDAFRYGAVEGCKAYFLSHFHSDHYIGLTSSWCHGPVYCSRVTANLVRRQLRVDPQWVFDLEFDRKIEVPETGGVEVTMIPANHCPGSSLYLFEKVVGRGKTPKVQRVLHCGDFRACPAHVQHPQLRPDIVDTVTGRNIAQQKLDVCYLDTTYLTPKYSFPSQEEVITACADMCVSLSKEKIDENDSWEKTKRERAGSGMVNFVKKDADQIHEEPNTPDDDFRNKTLNLTKNPTKKARGRLLVIVGTYSIGKERICLGVARALNSKIYASPNKQKICAALEDPELNARLTSDPLEAQVHMQMLMEIRAETLADYLTGFKPHFSRIVGFRPSGWNYRPPQGRATDSPAVHTVLHSSGWQSHYSMRDLVPQRGSTREAHCFGVPYSEHSSFRELTLFCCALRIDRIIPTVNVGSAKSREKMRGWCERWAAEKKKNGLYRVEEGRVEW